MNRPFTYLLGPDAAMSLFTAMAAGGGLVVGIHVFFITLFKR